MSSYEEIAVLFERYLDRELSDEERDSFEERLANDEALRIKLAEHIQLRKDVKLAYEADRMQSMMNEFHSGLSGGGRVISIRARRIRFISIAASVLVLVGVSSVFWLNQLGSGDSAGANDDYLYTMGEETLQNAIEDDVSEEPVIIGEATAFLIDQRGFLLTSYHVVKNNVSIVVEIRSDSLIEVSADLVAFDERLDIALLQLDTTLSLQFDRVPFTINGEADRGEEVFTLGYPTSKTDGVYELGAIASSTGFKDDTVSYQVSIAINAGNSGSPLFNTKGELIGIVSGKHAKADGASYALKSKEIIAFVDSLVAQDIVALNLPVKNYLKYEKRTKQIILLEDFIFRIKVKRQ